MRPINKNIASLLSVASDPISPNPPIGQLQGFGLSSARNQEMFCLLGGRNGFYAFESALLVRPLDFDGPPLGILQWNKTTLWKANYKISLSKAFFFAEDVFGVQFCILNDEINSFDPETGEFNVVAKNLEDWAGWILEDSKTRTGWPMAHFWQLRQGPLKPGMRLLPKVPFVLGGQFTIENLYVLNDTEGMRFRASIANQLRDCPDGTKVVLDIKRSQ